MCAFGLMNISGACLARGGKKKKSLGQNVTICLFSLYIQTCLNSHLLNGKVKLKAKGTDIELKINTKSSQIQFSALKFCKNKINPTVPGINLRCVNPF